MGKSNSSNAAALLESTISPILELTYDDPLFSLAAHPTRPILLSGLVTGHVYCNTYNAEKLEAKQQARREEILLLEKEAFSRGKISQITHSVSQSKNKWWTNIENSELVENYTTNWKTKRHKGSCRHAIFDPLVGSLGENVFTVGTDHIIKKASTETGRVLEKVTLSEDYPTSSDSITKLCHSTTHPLLLAGTENGHILIYDSKNFQNKYKVEQAHDDAVNHILPMPGTSAYHYLTLGSTTLTHIDIRKGVVSTSDNQEDELLSMCYPTDNGKDNDTVLVSHGEGIITIWKNSKNRFTDQLSRIKVNKAASIDAIIPTMNQDEGDLAASVWCGDSEGLLHRVNYKKGKVVETRVHSGSRGKTVDEVGMLEIDFDYRLISAGMDSLKIWSNGAEADLDASESDWSTDEGSDSEGENVSGDNQSHDEPDSDAETSDAEKSDAEKSDTEKSDTEKSDVEKSDTEKSDVEKSAGDSDIESENGSDSDSDSDCEEVEETPAVPNFVRRKRNDLAGIIKSSKPKKVTIDINKLTNTSTPEEAEVEEPTAKKQKIQKQLSTKQLRNLQKHEHGIKRFDGL